MHSTKRLLIQSVDQEELHHLNCSLACVVAGVNVDFPCQSLLRYLLP